MPQPGDEITVYYDGARLGLPGVAPTVRLGRVNALDAFVEEVPQKTMVELAPPTALFAARFTIPATTNFGTWIAMVKATISGVDRSFAFPVEIEKNAFLRDLSEIDGVDLTELGTWLVHNIRRIRRTMDRLAIPQSLIQQFDRDRIVAIVSDHLIQAGEDVTFSFVITSSDSGKPLNLEGATVTFLGEDEETEVNAWNVPCSITDEENGRCEAILSAALTATPGRFRGQVKAVLPGNVINLSQTFIITIEPAVSP